MSATFSIKSTSSDREISFSQYDGEDFNVEVKGTVSGATKVYGYAPHTHNLAHWFEKLGKKQKLGNHLRVNSS